MRNIAEDDGIIVLTEIYNFTISRTSQKTHVCRRQSMKSTITKSWPIIIFLMFFVFATGCSDKDKTDVGNAGQTEITQDESAVTTSDPAAPVDAPKTVPTGDIVASVDGKVYKKSELEKNVKEQMSILRDRIPADKRSEVQQQIRRQLVDAFVVKTLLEKEIGKKNIQATNQEVVDTMNNIKASLPPDKKIDDFLKENRITQEDIIFAVKVDKFRKMAVGQKAKPTQKEISKFYNDNRDKLFTEPEGVHVRHILTAFKKDDDDKTKAEKKAKIEDLRNQLLKGGNFAELAAKNSDCPSKEAGGDLNFIRRGQTVKPFEDAAFSQEKNAVGPVVETEYGYHIIQVLDKKPARKVTLDEVKDRISGYLEQGKQVEIFNNVINDLRQKAKVEIFM